MQKYRYLISLVLAFLVLSTSVGAVMYQHFCGGMLRQNALTQIDKHCDNHEGNHNACHIKNNGTMSCHQSDAKECCRTEKKAIATDEANTNQPAKINSPLVSVAYVLINHLFTNPFSRTIQYSTELSTPPPLPTRSIYRLIQSFLL